MLYTIPLRRVVVVQRDLLYPEGIKMAEFLDIDSRAAYEQNPYQESEPGTKDIELGGIVAVACSIASDSLRVLADNISLWFSARRIALPLSTGSSVVLVGTGYLVGIAGGMAMVGTLIARGMAVLWPASITPLKVSQSLGRCRHDAVIGEGLLRRRRHHVRRAGRLSWSGAYRM